MFGRDAVTNLSQFTKPKLRYMGTEDLILDIELMSNIFQTQIHNLRMARERVIEGQQPEMAKFAIPARNFPKNGKIAVILHADREKLT